MLGITSLFFAEPSNAQSKIRIDEKSNLREICGFSFPKNSQLVVTANRILESSLKNRIDNDRYNACPFYIYLKYHNQTAKIDFNNQMMLQDIKESSGYPLYFGTFVYENKNWHSLTPSYEKNSKIAFNESIKGILVTNTFFKEKNKDFCVDALWINEEKWMITSLCNKSKERVIAFREIFKEVYSLNFTTQKK